ncbi:MAG: T9SS type A sorting domain-containing protein [Bacteroidetes bacterium]|nr:T9SS type A sorting domain-containing protein [Bacteroidota bacterium]
MKKQILFFAAMMAAIFTNAQQVYKGGGTSNSTFLFGYTSYAAKSQCIFLPSDLTNAASGNIVTLYYKYGSSSNTLDQTLTNFTIKMGQTASTSFVGDTVFFTGLTTVLNEPSYTILGGVTGTWFAINLTTPFSYNATQTLIIQLTMDAVSVTGWGTYGTSNTPVKKVISPNVNATAGSPTSSTWQDMGFDLAPVGVMPVSSAAWTLNVFPNPCHDKLTVFIPGFADQRSSEISIVNVLGQEVLKKEILTKEMMSMDVSELPRGIYFLKAKLSGSEMTRKIVVE